MLRRESTPYTMSDMPTTEQYRVEEAARADERHRPIIMLHERGLNHAEIAKEIGRSREWVRKVIYRARKRGLLDDED